MAIKNNKYKVCVIFGGVSTEHLISLRSAYNIIRALRKDGHDVITIGITRNGEWLRFTGNDEMIQADEWEIYARTVQQPEVSPVTSISQYISNIAGTTPDVIFPAVHGINCEDGALQGLLELSGIPYVGCNVLSSAACMDKLHAKKIFKFSGIPQCKYVSFTRHSYEANPVKAHTVIASKIGFPCFLKPSNGGSSVGTMKVSVPKDLPGALRKTFEFDYTVIIEEFVNAREIEVAVMGNEIPKASMPGEIITSDNVGYYDYETKYFNPEDSTAVVPASLPEKTTARVRNLAKKAYRSIGCTGLARVDFFLDKTSGKLFLNEINTLPGFTSISLFPKAWEASSVPQHKLVTKLCTYAITNKNTKKRTELI